VGGTRKRKKQQPDRQMNPFFKKGKRKPDSERPRSRMIRVGRGNGFNTTSQRMSGDSLLIWRNTNLLIRKTGRAKNDGEAPGLPSRGREKK